MIRERKIQRVNRQGVESLSDVVAIEAPLEITLKKEGEITGRKISITMRTPGQDVYLALGFLFTEGILDDFNQVISANELEENQIEVVVNDTVNIQQQQLDRNFYTTSSCGVCGKASIDAISTVSAFDIDSNEFRVKREVLYALPSTLLKHQETFNQTGGIHAAALFHPNGELHAYQEDVGRHNAMDKLIGEAWSKGEIPAQNFLLLLSGRASFELLQKAGMAGIPVVASVGAPSSLAIELAEDQGITLTGFLKSDRFNLYTRYERIQ